VKTLCAALLFLLLAGEMYAQTVQHPVKINLTVVDDADDQQIKTPFLMALGNNPHYELVDSEWDIEIAFACLWVHKAAEGFVCAAHYTYYDSWNIKYTFPLRVYSGGAQYIADSMLAALNEDTTPESLQHARVTTKHIADRIRSTALMAKSH